MTIKMKANEPFLLVLHENCDCNFESVDRRNSN